MAAFDLIAFDMDGTLLDSNKEIREDSRRAIEEASLAGKHVTLSTGRSLPELADILPVIPSVRYVIAVSGALIYDAKAKKSLFRAPIPEETVLEMLRRLRGEDIMIHMHSDKSYVQRDKEAHMADYHMGVYQSFFDRVATKADDLESAFSAERFPVYKFNIYPRDASLRESFRQRLEGLPLTFANAEEASLECSARGISKASGLLSLCTFLNIDIARTIAVGDSDNDLAILKAAGLAIAMGNATPNALALAGAVVKDNDCGGCAEAIYNYLLA